VTAAPAGVTGLQRLFAPRSIAIVGASDSSGWATNIVANLDLVGFDGRVEMIHPGRPSAFGRPTRPRLTDLDDPVDLAFALVPPHAVASVLEDAGAAGIANLLVLAGGFGESGEAGRAAERGLAERAAALGVRLIGPNGLGFINTVARVAPYGLRITPPLARGPVGVLLQSGGLASNLLTFARAHAIGISLLVSMGNEAMLTTADVLEHLIEDEHTRVIAMFLEQIRDAARFLELAQRAQRAGKPIVALKVGRGAPGQKAAQAHTGALAADDRVVDAVLRQSGVIRVDCLEELLVTAGVLGYGEIPAGRRVGVVTGSGGACDLIADLAERHDIELPDFAQGTLAGLAAAFPPTASLHNPIDVTGFGLANGQQAATSEVDDALAIVSRDPNLDFIVFTGVSLPDNPAPEIRPLIERRLAALRAILDACPVPVISMTSLCTDLGPYSREKLTDHGIHVAAGIQFGMTALGHALWWADRRRDQSARDLLAPPDLGLLAVDRTGPRGTWSEWRARELLRSGDVPVVPARLVTSAEEAAAAAAALGFPVALKVCAADLAHKSDVGGVQLSIGSPAQARAAFARIQQAVATARPDAAVDGVLVAPMRSGGIELIVGVTVDAQFGPVLALGLGGIWTEAMADVSLRVLPVDEAEILAMLGELRAGAVLDGARGQAPVDRARLARVVHRIARCALSLGPALDAFEVNPLWARGSEIEALDVLCVTR
jgi:acetate---CoA ligase (ADP-forming)